MEEYFRAEMEAAVAERRDFRLSKQRLTEWVEEYGKERVAEACLRALREAQVPLLLSHVDLIEKRVGNIKKHVPNMAKRDVVWSYKINDNNTLVEAPEGSVLLKMNPVLRGLNTILSGPERLSRRYHPKIISVAELWDDDFHVRRGIAYLLQKNFTQVQLRAFLMQRTGYYTPFPVPVAYWIYNEFSSRLNRPLRIFDPCAGWSDRLAAALISEPSVVASYHAIDPWEVTRGVCEKTLGLFPRGRTEKESFGIYEGRAEDPDTPFPESDLVFTSPPYGDLEIYSGDPESDASTREINDFLTGFLSPLLHKASKAVEQSQGYVVINLGNNTRPGLPKDSKEVSGRLTEHLVELAQEAGLVLVETLGMSLTSRNWHSPTERPRSTRAEPIFVFQRVQ